MLRIPKQAVTCIIFNIRRKHTGKFRLSPFNWSQLQLVLNIIICLYLLNLSIFFTRPQPFPWCSEFIVNEKSICSFTSTVWMLQRKQTASGGSSTTVKVETAKRSFTPLTEAPTWSWWRPETSEQARSCCMTTVIAVRPRFWLILGSNTESINASPFHQLFVVGLVFLKYHYYLIKMPQRNSPSCPCKYNRLYLK